MKYLILTLLMFSGIASAIAQKTVLSTDAMDVSFHEQEISGECIYLDSDEKICYLDLEKVSQNLRQAVLINSHGDEVMVKSLVNTPVNSIVELDYSKLPSGSYLLELRSYTGKSHKALRL